MAKKFEIVDFLRGYSITTIVLMHLLQSYDLPSFFLKVIAFGGAGVHVFILCSGFGLYLSYLHKPVDYKTFLKRRFGRIYWPMALICVITALWMAYQGKEFIYPLLGNIFLFKMFVPSLECSMGVQMWFVSTIIQFYVAWPLIVRLIQNRGGRWIALLISLAWATAVWLAGYGEERIWNSFFLQYLWEFCFGMKMAEVYFNNPKALSIPSWMYLILACMAGMALSGVMGWMGTPWSLYNDIPSLMGYLSFALIVYKLRFISLNRLFGYISHFSYEWYLVHILVFSIVTDIFDKYMPISVIIFLCISASVIVAIGYTRLFNMEYTKLWKR